jgi:hypothetical protein
VILQVAGFIITLQSHIINAWESDVKRIVTRGTVVAILALCEGLWKLELLGHNHTLWDCEEVSNDWRRDLACFLFDNGEPTIAMPQLSVVSREVYNNAAHLSYLLLTIMESGDLRGVVLDVPDRLPLMQGAYSWAHATIIFSAHLFTLVRT